MNLTIDKVGSTTGIHLPGGNEESSSGRAKVTVFYTTIEGTLAALEAAIHLSKGLNADITLLIAEEVPPYFPLAHAPIAFAFLERVSNAILGELALDPGDVSVGISLCRRRVDYLRTALAPHSLVVLGKRHRWGWLCRERRLERWLRSFGHDALLVQAGADGLHTRAVMQRLVERDARVA